MIFRGHGKAVIRGVMAQALNFHGFWANVSEISI